MHCAQIDVHPHLRHPPMDGLPVLHPDFCGNSWPEFCPDSCPNSCPNLKVGVAIAPDLGWRSAGVASTPGLGVMCVDSPLPGFTVCDDWIVFQNRLKPPGWNRDAALHRV
jgi:hypothetical protein